MARTPAKQALPEMNSSKKAKFDEIIASLNKEIDSDNGVILAKLSDRPMDVKTISTGSVVLDSITGGGYPVGRLIEIYGAESSGKTTMALIAAANVQRMGGNVAFIDLENALDPRYARKLGVNTDELAVSQPDYGEQALTLVGRLASSGVVDLIIVDSIASLVPKAELEGSMEQATIGLIARLMSKALKQLAPIANRTQTTIIFINQTRDAIGSFSPYGTPQTTTGGKAMRFFASQRIEVKRKGPVKEGNTAIGNEVRMKVVKNKIAPPFGEGVTIITFNKGINRAAEAIEVGPAYGVIEKPNNRTYIEAETGNVIGKSKAEAVEALENDPEMMERISVALHKIIQDNLFSDNGVSEESDPLLEEASDDEDVVFDEPAPAEEARPSEDEA